MKKKDSEEVEQFTMPLLGYIIGKVAFTFKPFSLIFDKLESRLLRKKMNKLTIDRPIYITGIARAGTTITLEMLSHHPDLASHRYKHMPMPYLPYLFSFIIDKTNMYTTPQERLHRDRLMVTRDSPDALEEIFWQSYFDHAHDESYSNVFNEKVSNPEFEKFYRDHIRKLIISQNASRYLTKNNYNVTRMQYLIKLFPTAKFLLIIRNPVNHIASLTKQSNLFIELEKEEPLLMEWTRIIGHREFGHNRVCINVNNTDEIRKIRKLWINKATYVKAWAIYWSSIYDYVADLLESNKKLKKATLIVRYEDLCGTPEQTIDKILEHTELNPKKFEKVKKHYAKRLTPPAYYQPNFTEQELADIAEVTKETAARFGY